MLHELTTHFVIDEFEPAIESSIESVRVEWASSETGISDSIFCNIPLCVIFADRHSHFAINHIRLEVNRPWHTIIVYPK